MSDSSKASLAGLKVLVVEDEALVSMLLEDMLSDLGCEIVGPIMRLREALAMAEDESQAIDVAILDVNLAGERSFPVAEALEKRGARPLLRKPFLPHQLEQVLLEALAGAPAA